MEGLTGPVWRRLHHRFFGGADAYYTPFVTPTREPKFTDRQLKDVGVEANTGLTVVPQLLTRRAEDFCWATKALLTMGYGEVNLNLGCPAGTVVAKGKGSGFLRTPTELDTFFDDVFTALGSDVPVTVKTRLGWSETYEFADLVRLYNRHPIKRLIVHPRLKTDFYKGDARWSILRDEYDGLTLPLGINGDLVTTDDIRMKAREFPRAEEIMVGRALIADPALFRKMKGGAAASRDEIFDFMETLLAEFTDAFQSYKNSLMRMKEYWFFQQFLFDGAEKHVKAIFKAKNGADYNAAVQRLNDELPLRNEAAFGWHKPL